MMVERMSAGCVVVLEPGSHLRRCDGIGEDLLQQGDERNEGPRRLVLVRRQQLVAELGHDGGRVVLRSPTLRGRKAHAVVLDDEAVEPLEGEVLVGEQLLQPVDGRPDGLVEESEEQLVLAREVLVEAAERLAGTVDDLLHGELLAGLGAGQELEPGVEEALHATLAAHPGRVERPDAGRRRTGASPAGVGTGVSADIA